jgi:hypothetical protein
MDSNSRGVLLGLVLGVLFIVGVAVIGFDWGTKRIQTASVPVNFPIMFQPK